MDIIYTYGGDDHQFRPLSAGFDFYGANLARMTLMGADHFGQNLASLEGQYGQHSFAVCAGSGV